jgi:hypothetical protein
MCRGLIVWDVNGIGTNFKPELGNVVIDGLDPEGCRNRCGRMRVTNRLGASPVLVRENIRACSL